MMDDPASPTEAPLPAECQMCSRDDCSVCAVHSELQSVLTMIHLCWRLAPGHRAANDVDFLSPRDWIGYSTEDPDKWLEMKDAHFKGPDQRVSGSESLSGGMMQKKSG